MCLFVGPPGRKRASLPTAFTLRTLAHIWHVTYLAGRAAPASHEFSPNVHPLSTHACYMVGRPPKRASSALQTGLSKPTQEHWTHACPLLRPKFAWPAEARNGCSSATPRACWSCSARSPPSLRGFGQVPGIGDWELLRLVDPSCWLVFGT